MKREKTEWLTRAEFGARLNVSASMVTRYVHRGLASRADKKIEWPAGRAWVKDNIVPEKSGNYSQRRGASQKVSKIEIRHRGAPVHAPLRGAEEIGAHRLLDAIRNNSRIGELLAKLGAPAAVITGGADLLDAVLAVADDMVPGYMWPRLPIVDEGTVTPATQAAADAFFDRITKFYAEKSK